LVVIFSLHAKSSPIKKSLILYFFCSHGSQKGLTSASRQMTIFYGGQAHVFDDVHPNKVCFPFVC
jgi:hypothetical protein